MITEAAEGPVIIPKKKSNAIWNYFEVCDESEDGKQMAR